MRTKKLTAIIIITSIAITLAIPAVAGITNTAEPHTSVSETRDAKVADALEILKDVVGIPNIAAELFPDLEEFKVVHSLDVLKGIVGIREAVKVKDIPRKEVNFQLVTFRHADQYNGKQAFEIDTIYYYYELHSYPHLYLPQSINEDFFEDKALIVINHKPIYSDGGPDMLINSLMGRGRNLEIHTTELERCKKIVHNCTFCNCNWYHIVLAVNRDDLEKFTKFQRKNKVVNLREGCFTTSDGNHLALCTDKAIIATNNWIQNIDFFQN